MPASTRQGNTIDAAEVNQALAHTRLGGYILHFPEVESTNDLALQAAQQGAKRGVWVADAQTAGRGRGGHTWHSTPGDGLYVSALFTPRLPAWSGAPASLSLTAGLAAWEAIRDVTGITADIRWPNDLVTRPVALERSRKLGGVLVEAAFGQPEGTGQRAMLRYAVIGIGINVAHRSFPPDISNLASSLYLEGWQVPDRQPILIALLDKLDWFIRKQEDGYAGTENGPGLSTRLAEASTWLHGKRVHVPEEGGYTGVTAGLDSSGFLLVDSEDGVRRTVRSGGVREL
jgi:BirA family transcriptional regulator, biotin operon repressor / biotin---[acetyl-CoA-carboxylase] ligase